MSGMEEGGASWSAPNENETFSTTTTIDLDDYYSGFCSELPVMFSLAAINFLLVLVGVFNNFLVAFVVWKTKSMQNPTNILLSNNAIAEVMYLVASGLDFIMVTLARVNVITSSQAMDYIRRRGPLSMLSFAPFLVVTINLALLSIERYNAVCNPMKIQRRLGKRSCKLFTLSLWCASIILVFPVTADITQNEGYITDFNVGIYFCSLFAVVSTIAGCTIIYCYGRIISGIYISKTICNQTCNATMSEDVKAKRNIVKMLLSLTLTFVILKYPSTIYTAIMLLFPLDLHLFNCLAFSLETLAHVSAFLSPIIYLVFCSNYRQGALRLLRCSRRRRVVSHD